VTSPPTRIRSVSKAVQILLFIAREGDDGVSARQVAETLGLPIATTYHLLNTLQAEGMVAKDARKAYHLGAASRLLADAFARRPGPPEYLLGPLRTLAAETGETAYLSGWERDDATVLATVEGTQAVRVMGLHTGFSGAAHARASGKVFLAFAPPAVRERYLRDHPLEPLTPRTIIDPEAFGRELGGIAKRGYAVDREEFILGVSCVAAPVIDGGTARYAYTVSVPIDRFARQRAHLITAVLAAARAARAAEVEASA
jgi:IclR family transcriptional regulator, acetate operon repressor